MWYPSEGSLMLIEASGLNVKVEREETHEEGTRGRGGPGRVIGEVGEGGHDLKVVGVEEADKGGQGRLLRLVQSSTQY